MSSRSSSAVVSVPPSVTRPEVGGQSGHPLSPYWGAGHEDWVHGRATPLLPGPAQHTLRLLPAR